MKMFRYLIALVLVCALVVALPFHAQASDSLLTLDRAIQVSDTEIVLEFSEPVAINKFQTNRGPYAALRWLPSAGTVAYALNEYNVNGDALQWTGEFSFIGDDHSKLLWKMTQSRFNCNTIEEVRHCSHPDAVRSIEKNKLKIGFVLEEVPYNEKMLAADGKIDNVTTVDGSKHLTPNWPKGWESCIMELEVDYNYPIDRSAIRGIYSATQDWDFDVIFKGDGLAATDAPAENVEVVKTLKNDPVTIAMIFGADLLLIAVAVVVILVVKKKRKAA